MTIAACYLSTEGVILGADSTSTSTLTVAGERSIQHLEFAQKLFEIGEKGTMGVVCWGLGSISDTSFRTLAAELGDEFDSKPDYTALQAAEWWKDRFWGLYEISLAPQLARAKQLQARDAELQAKLIVGALDTDEASELTDIKKEANEMAIYAGGFCVAGRDAKDRKPRAYEIVYGPFIDRSKCITQVKVGWRFWGCPNVVERTIFGIDSATKGAILASGKWNGTLADLNTALTPISLQPYTILPLREAVDWVYSMLYSTVKAYKFSAMPAVCGGPIEIAMISSDRPFRWVRHKSLGAALASGDNSHFGDL